MGIDEEIDEQRAAYIEKLIEIAEDPLRPIISEVKAAAAAAGLTVVLEEP